MKHRSHINALKAVPITLRKSQSILQKVCVGTCRKRFQTAHAVFQHLTVQKPCKLLWKPPLARVRKIRKCCPFHSFHNRRICLISDTSVIKCEKHLPLTLRLRVKQSVCGITAKQLHKIQKRVRRRVKLLLNAS